MTNGEMLSEILEAAVAQGQAPGVVAAVAHGDETLVKAAGRMAVDGPPMRADTLFRISSTTKPITAAVILGLVEDGSPLDPAGYTQIPVRVKETTGAAWAQLIGPAGPLALPPLLLTRAVHVRGGGVQLGQVQLATSGRSSPCSRV